jgi:hypothetical protein
VLRHGRSGWLATQELPVDERLALVAACARSTRRRVAALDREIAPVALEWPRWCRPMSIPGVNAETAAKFMASVLSSSLSGPATAAPIWVVLDVPERAPTASILAPREGQTLVARAPNAAMGDGDASGRGRVRVGG